MMQSFDTQLQVSLRALKEVVAPALADSESHVLEQLQLAIATLEFTRQRLPYARPYHRLELQKVIDLSQEVADLVGTDQADNRAALTEASANARALLHQPDAEVEQYIQVGRTLREGITEAVRHSAGQPYESELDQLIVERQRVLFTLQRVWCAPLGLDGKAASLPSIDALLQQAEHS